jgi:PTS system fructose-specific IIC component
MKIADFLTQDRILLNLKASSKEEAIKEIAGLLGSSKEVIDFDLFLKDVFERESLNTTGIGNHIAIPHARTDAVKDFVIAFGRAPEGIEFNSLDKRPAKFIFLMGTPKEKGLSNYLKMLARLTRLLNKEDFQEALGKASAPGEVIEQFRKAEDKII